MRIRAVPLLAGSHAFTLYALAVYRFVQSLLILDMAGGAGVLANIFIIFNISAVFALIGGILADRFTPKKLLAAYDALSGVIILGLLLAINAGFNSVVPVIVATAGLAILNSMYIPTVFAYVPMLAGNGKTTGAFGITVAFHILSAMALYPSLKGLSVLLYFGGMDAVFAVSCTIFLIAGAMKLFVAPPVQNDAPAAPGCIADTRQRAGVGGIFRQPFLYRILLPALLLGFALAPLLDVAVPFLLEHSFQGSYQTNSVAQAFTRVAAILGAFSVFFLAKRISAARAYQLLLILAGLLLPMAAAPFVAGNSLAVGFLLFLACTVVVSAVISLLSVVLLSEIPKWVLPNRLGTVMGILYMLVQAGFLAGRYLFELLFSLLSAASYITILIACVILFVGAFLLKQQRKNYI